MTTTEIATRDRWLRFAAMAVALMAVIPFVLPFHHPPLQSFYQEWIAFALGSTAYLLAGITTDHRRIEAPRSIAFPVGLAILVAVQVALGKVPYWQQGVLGALYMLWAAAMLAAGFMLRRRLGWDRFAVSLAWALLAGAMLTAALAAAQLLGRNPLGWVTPVAMPRLYGNLGQPNHFADYLALGLFSAGFLVAVRRINPVAGFAAGLLLLVALDLSGSRAVWIYLGAGAALAAWLHFSRCSSESRRAIVWAGSMLVLFTAIQFATALLADSSLRWESVAVRSTLDMSGPSDRLHNWYGALLMFSDAPVFGVGFSGFPWHYFSNFDQLPGSSYPGLVDNAHNLVFHLLAEFGLAGALLLGVCAVIWGAGQARLPMTVHRWWALTLIAIVMAHSLLEYPLWYAYFLGVFALLLGATEEQPWRFNSGALDRIAFAAAGVLAAWTLATVLLDYRRVEAIAGVSGSALDANEWSSVALDLQRTSLLSHIVERELVRTIRLDGEKLPEKLELNSRVLRYRPTADVAYRQAALSALSGDAAGALRHWDRAAASFPSEAARVSAALRELAQGDQPRLMPLVEYAASRSKE